MYGTMGLLAYEGSARGAFVAELLLHRPVGVVDLGAFARGLATAVRVLVGFDAQRKHPVAVLVAPDPQAVGEAVGARLALAAAGLGLGRAEAAALALVALVGREGRAVGVRDQRQQLVEDHVLPPLALGWHLAAVGIRLVRQARLAPGAEAVAVVAQLPFGHRSVMDLQR